MTLKELLDAEIEYCRDHIEYFVETYCHIEDKDSEDIVQPFNLWPMQREALISLYEHRLNVVLKARQLGMTWVSLAIACHLIVCYPGRTVMMLSRTEEDAKELVRRLTFMLENMPELCRKEGKNGFIGPTYKATTLSIEIIHPGGSSSFCRAFPAASGAGRGYSGDLVILDEWAFQQYAEEIWTSIYPVVNRPYGGKVIGVSTIERGTLFEQIVLEHEERGFNLVFLPWYASPHRTQEWYDNTHKALGDKVLQEYPATIEEALTIPGGAFFPEYKKEVHVKHVDLGNVNRYISIDFGLDMFAAYWIAVDEKSHAHVYREIHEPNHTISSACELLKRYFSDDEEIYLILGPHDMWNRESTTGKVRADIFAENGIILTRTTKDLAAGCAAMKEWLKIGPSGPKMTFEDCPNLQNSLGKVQKDKKRPDIYAKEPHALTHSLDALRGFCVYWTNPAEIKDRSVRRKWTPDMIEDYNNANEKDREYLLKKYGPRSL